MAISAIPTGLPTFVQAMLAYGARQLADAKAVVANLNDVETLGATSSINSDKTGTLTLNEMTVTALYTVGQHFTVEGTGYGKTGRILQAAGGEVPDLTPLAYGLVLASDATVSDDGDVIGDPTEAALVVLAAKIGIDAEESRRTYPRVAAVPFDSAYKFMATAHWLPWRGDRTLVEVVKGGPDVVLQRCTQALAGPGQIVDLETMRADIEAEMERLAKQGLRTLAFAVRFLTPADEAAARGRPDVVRRGAGVRRPGRDRRPAAPDRQDRRRDRAQGRHRGPHDHRRPRGHRERDRRPAGPRARARSAARSSRS